MTARILTATRTAMAQAIITAVGSGGLLKLYSGTVPTNLGTPAGTKLATCTWTGVPIGTATAGGIDINESGLSQGGTGQLTTADYVAGTPTFARITTSGDVAHMDISIGAGTDEWDFTGTVATGQNVTFTGLSLTMPNAST